MRLMSPLSRSPRPLREILSTFQKAHTELLTLEQSHFDQEARHEHSIAALEDRIADLKVERGLSASIRQRLSEFLLGH